MTKENINEVTRTESHDNLLTNIVGIELNNTKSELLAVPTSEPADIKNRLEMIDKACKKEIASKKTEIKSKITRLQESKQEIDNLQKELKGLTNNPKALNKLTSAISRAFDEVQEWTPGMLATISIVEEYNNYLKNINHPIDGLVTQCSETIRLLADEVKSHIGSTRFGTCRCRSYSWCSCSAHFSND